MWRKCRQYKGTERFTSRVEGRGKVRQYRGTERFTNSCPFRRVLDMRQV